MSAGVATLSFFVASYLVNRSQIHQELSVQLPLFPAPDTFVNVVKLGFDVMDFVFLALVVWEAWRIPQPVEL